MSAVQELIQIIRTFYQQHNAVPTCKQLGVRTERFRYHFGSYTNALVAAGMSISPPLPSQQQCAAVGCTNTFKPRERNRKFCSQSCAARTNTTGRSHTEHTKRKIQKSLAKHRYQYCKVYFMSCKVCNSSFVSRTSSRHICSDSCRSEDLSKRAISNPSFGGNRSRNFITHITPSGVSYTLDSSWEAKLANALDRADVEWSRPTEPLTYVDTSGKRRRYFPDFYIPQHDLYVDTKNPWRLSMDIDKLTRVTDQRDITLLIISSIDHIMVEHIQPYVKGLHIIGADGETRTHDSRNTKPVQ